jgi:peptide-methionine (S)-S-oxide reductase
MNTPSRRRQASSAATVFAAVLAGGSFMASPHPAAGQPAEGPEAKKTNSVDQTEEGLQTITFGSGCFWCTEAVFDALKGVKSAESGYSGGFVANPSYEQVCTGMTGHAEVIQVTYDPKVIPFASLLEVFWQTHDPTTPNQQGPDHGTQYRSAIFYHTEDQRREAEHYLRKLDESGAFDAPIVTEITPFEAFFPAEDYHQEYYAANPRAGYCRAVISPKMRKFRKAFGDMLKTKEELREQAQEQDN